LRTFDFFRNFSQKAAQKMFSLTEENFPSKMILREKEKKLFDKAFEIERI
jgi:hypothetical protein